MFVVAKVCNGYGRFKIWVKYKYFLVTVIFVLVRGEATYEANVGLACALGFNIFMNTNWHSLVLFNSHLINFVLYNHEGVVKLLWFMKFLLLV